MSTGQASFLFTGGLIVVTIFLIRSMLGHLRKIRTAPVTAAVEPTELQEEPSARGEGQPSRPREEQT